VDLRADLWASAVLTYHCISGAVPFDGETFGAVAIAVTQGQFAPPFAQYGVGSPALDAWFNKALARDLNARFTSAEELSEAFAQATGAWQGATNATGSGHALSGTAVAATLGTNPGQAAPTFNGVANTMARGGPRGVVLAAGSLAALAVLVGVGVVVLKTREPPPTPIAATVTAATAATPLPSSNRPAMPSATQTEPGAPQPPPTVSAPAPSTKPVVPPPRKPKPVTPPVSPPSSRPDRGF
jgi:eukaryotic-like serine/threonine-protein kinase